MSIKGEANAFKLEVAKGLKQLSENAEIVIGKKVINNTTEVKIEDKSTHLAINLNFILVGSAALEQAAAISKRVKEVIEGQSEVIKASGDEAFEPYVSQGVIPSMATTGTASAIVIQNINYISKGEPKPIFINAPGTLPVSVTVVQPEIKTEKT